MTAGAPPLHILIDADGRIAAIAREAGPQTIERIADHAKRLLEELDPLGDTRFATCGATQIRLKFNPWCIENMDESPWRWVWACVRSRWHAGDGEILLRPRWRLPP